MENESVIRRFLTQSIDAALAAGADVIEDTGAKDSLALRYIKSACATTDAKVKESHQYPVLMREPLREALKAGASADRIKAFPTHWEVGALYILLKTEEESKS